jgi:hypothetical protein
MKKAKRDGKATKVTKFVKVRRTRIASLHKSLESIKANAVLLRGIALHAMLTKLLIRLMLAYWPKTARLLLGVTEAQMMPSTLRLCLAP